MTTMNVSGWMFLLVPAHPGCLGQIPHSRKMVLCCVCVCVPSFNISGSITHSMDLAHYNLHKWVSESMEKLPQNGTPSLFFSIELVNFLKMLFPSQMMLAGSGCLQKLWRVIHFAAFFSVCNCFGDCSWFLAYIFEPAGLLWPHFEVAAALICIELFCVGCLPPNFQTMHSVFSKYLCAGLGDQLDQTGLPEGWVALHSITFSLLKWLIDWNHVGLAYLSATWSVNGIFNDI